MGVCVYIRICIYKERYSICARLFSSAFLSFLLFCQGINHNKQRTCFKPTSFHNDGVFSVCLRQLSVSMCMCVPMRCVCVKI